MKNSSFYRSKILVLLLLMLFKNLSTQTIIGGNDRDPSAILELRSNDKGLLLPRLSVSDRSAIPNPATGLLIYNTTLNCVEVNIGNPSAPSWSCLSRTQQYIGSVVNIECSNPVHQGLIISGQPVSNANTTLYYTGGNGGLIPAQTLYSTGVTGLTATLSSGNLSCGPGSITFVISGNPSNSGTAQFSVTIGNFSCSFNRTIGISEGGVSLISCNDKVITAPDFFVTGQPVSQTTISIPYVGLGGSHGGQQVPSTEVTGLTATLSAGEYEYGVGSLQYTVTGVPSGCGRSIFQIPIGGQSCYVSFVSKPDSSSSNCGACISPNVWKEFMCHNLGANENVDPFTPSWELNGNYYQWGRSTVVAFGPSGSSNDQSNGGALNTWNTVSAPTFSWTDAVKTTNDPCPVGYRLPTHLQWDGVVQHNYITRQGSWESDNTNYGSGIKFGDNLYLPMAGFRYHLINGALDARGSHGLYWSSTEYSTDAWYLFVLQNGASINTTVRINGLSIRCIKI